MVSQTDLAILVGRFQPFHRAHAVLLEQALRVAPRVVVILGSAHHARTTKNPFTWQERAAMISDTLPAADRLRVAFAPVRDLYDDARWCEAVRNAVQQQAWGAQSFSLVGCLKDRSSYYLRRFPSWQLVSVDRVGELEAQSLRQRWFESADPRQAIALSEAELPPAVARALIEFSATSHWERLREEHHAILRSREQYGVGPFVTVDAVVTARGHVLLVQRGRAPGRDLWALPGGFLDPAESLHEAALRELQEETGLTLRESDDSAEPLQPLAVQVFSHPARSIRARTITHAHHFDLGEIEELPRVQGADDAAAAQWLPIESLPGLEDQLFDDHFHILHHFLRVPYAPD